ncbi:MAG: hypothetical protein GY832_19485 [Chloroflexi bacterium]|nr:hypothetical protein [Chloroflexota bacterium]
MTKTKTQTQNPSTRNWPLLIGLLLLAFGLRIYRLDAQSIWVDEGISLHLAISSLSEIVADRAANIHPPLYFFLLKGWVALTGVNTYSARFLSVMGSLLQVAVIYAVARRLLNRATAQIAALLTTLSPLSIIYGQEIRTYALLPLVYLILLAITYKLTQKPTPNHRIAWILLGVVEVVGLHLHYTAIFLVAYAGAWTTLAFWKQGRWADLRRWLITQLFAALACLPWLIAVITHWSDVQDRLGRGLGLADSVPLNYLLSQVWVFHLTGLAGAVGLDTTRKLADLVLFCLILLLLLRLRHPSSRRIAAQLTSHWLVPLGAALLIWTVRSFSHPRYISLYVPGLIILTAHILQSPSHITFHASRFTHHVSRITLAISLSLIFFLGLRAYFFDPKFSKDDVRGIAHYLEETAGPNDLILIPESDWSLTFVYRGESAVEMPALANKQRLWADLARWTTQRQHVFVIDYRRDVRDWRDMVFFALENAGPKVARRDFKGLTVHTYRLNRPVEMPTLNPLETRARFDPLILTHAWVEDETPADTAVTLVLRWRLEESTAQRCGLAIRLLDVDGWPLVTRDVLLLDEQLQPTDYWAAGQETTTYHVLSIPAALPPLSYTLNLGLYEQTEIGLHPLDLLDSQGAPQGQWLDIASVHLATSRTDNPYGIQIIPPPLPQPADLADGLQLLGAELDRSALGPGQSLFVTLHWQATRSPLPDLHPQLALVQAGQEVSVVESAPALGRYPTSRWQDGETVVEHRRLVVPLTAADGPADVTLAVGDQQLVLGQVEIDAQEHTFTPPPIIYPLDVHLGQIARLLGYDLPSHAIEGLSAAEPITLTLYWQALAGTTDTNYTVFTHILAADGHLVGGHDGLPRGGTRPTLGWIPDEIVIDQHIMTLREPYTGPTRIEVGLYDPITMERVTISGGETFILLPTILTIQDN